MRKQKAAILTRETREREVKEREKNNREFERGNNENSEKKLMGWEGGERCKTVTRLCAFVNRWTVASREKGKRKASKGKGKKEQFC